MPDRQQNARSIAALMRDLDLCMLTTHAGNGVLHTRPMSNNGEVEFEGDLWFFADAGSRKVREIEKNSQVSVAFSAPDRGIWIGLEGKGSIVRDAKKKQELWLEELRRWFASGPTDEGVVLIRVEATRAEHWGRSEGVVELG